MIRLWIASILWGLSVSAAQASDPGSCRAEARVALANKYSGQFGAGSWVNGPITIKEAEAEGLRSMEDCPHCPKKPFGYANEKWRVFARQMAPGDCLVSFRNDSAAWESLLGAEGYAIIRGGRLHRVFVTLMS